MIRIFALASVLFALAAPAAAKERSFVLGNFERIVVEGDIKVDIATNSSPRASADGTQDQLDRIRLVRNGNTLTVRLVSPVRTSRNDRENSGPIWVQLATRRLSDIIVRGNGVVRADALADRSVRLMMSGNGQMTIGSVEADQFYLNIVGAGLVAIGGGTAREGQVQLNGPATWQAPAMQLDRLDLNHSGAGNSTVSVEEFARISNNGTGQIAIGGDADCDIRSTGSAQIVCGNGEALLQP